jgi:DNA polymerase-2
MDGILESARVTALPVQQAARLSPGTGISAMQIVTALRNSILVPWHKQQAEMPKSAIDLLHADQGGLVYQPTIGLHTDVAEIDFVSMYPSIMARFNVSPETVSVPNQQSEIGNQQFTWVPELNLRVDQSMTGLIPQTLQPLLEKRIAFKQRIPELPNWDPRRQVYKARAAAHKWLLVTCFGYLGYKNARFGCIEAHQAVTAYSRECLLRAKEAAEDAGFTVLHLYVDGLWVQRKHHSGSSEALTIQDVQPLLDEIAVRTGLPIALDGIYRWVAFLPSRIDARVPVANRYFGVFQDRSTKVRGIEARRHDTPPFIAQTQLALLERLAIDPNAEDLSNLLPDLIAFLRRQIHLLRGGRVPLPDLLVTQKLSRELHLYRTPSPAARAAMQLQEVGKPVRPGQPIKLLYTLGEPGVHAWDCPPTPSPAQLNTAIYTRLMLRAAESIVQPLGVSPEKLTTWVLDNAHYLAEDKNPLFQKFASMGPVSIKMNQLIPL